MTSNLKYSITTSDGKTHEVSEDNINKYGIEAYAAAYKDATIRMRDSDGADYDIPLVHYNSAAAEGLRAFTIDRYPVTQPPQTSAGVQVQATPAPVAKPAQATPTPKPAVQPAAQPTTQQNPTAQQAPDSRVAGMGGVVSKAVARVNAGRKAAQLPYGRTYIMRRGGKDFMVDESEVKFYGGFDKWAQAHPGAPARVYMRNKQGHRVHIPLSMLNDYVSKGWWAEAKTNNPQLPSSGNKKQGTWTPTPAQRAAASQEVGRIVQNAQATTQAISEQGHRMIESTTQEGRDRQKAAEFQAHLMGAPTKVMGLTPVASAETETDGSSSEGAKSPHSGQSPVPYSVKMVDGEPVTEWMLPDGSLTTNLVEADRAESVARGARLDNALRRRMIKNGLNPDKPEDVQMQQIQERLAANEAKLRALYAKRDAQTQDKENSGSTWDRFVSTVGGGAHRSMTGHAPRPEVTLTANDKAIRDLLAENDMLEEARRTLKASGTLKKSEGWLNGLFDVKNNLINMVHGAWDKLQDVDLYGGGVMAAHKAERLDRLKDKLQRGEELTDSELSLAYSAMLSSNVMKSADLPHAYKFAQTQVEMVPFILQMALNPASGLSRGLVRKYGKSALKKVMLTIGGDIAEAGVLANTLQAQSTIADIRDRHRGEVTLRDGSFAFEGGENWAAAIAKGEGAAVIENYTELLGSHFGAIASGIGKGIAKGATKIGAGKAVDVVSGLARNVKASDWSKALAKIERRTQLQGPIGEILEEEAGIVLNSIFVGDNQLSDLTDIEQQIDIVLGAGFLGGFMSAVKTAGYPIGRARANRKLKTAEGNCANMFGDNWSEIQSTIENAEDRELSDVVVAMASQYATHPSLAKGIVEYAQALVKARGYNLADVSVRQEAQESAETEAAESVRELADDSVETAYASGADIFDAFDAGTPEEQTEARADMDAIAVRMQEAYQECEDVFGVEAEVRMAEMQEDPWGLLMNPELTVDQQDAVLYYINAKAAMDGVQDAADESAEAKRNAVTQAVEDRTHKETGVIIPATMKVDDRQVYIIARNVVMHEDGSGVDVRNSDSSVVVMDAESGKLEFASPDQIARIEEAIDPQTELDSALAEIEAQRNVFAAEDTQSEPVASSENIVEGNNDSENIPASTVEEYDRGYADGLEVAKQIDDTTLSQAISDLRERYKDGSLSDEWRGRLEAYEYEQQNRATNAVPKTEEIVPNPMENAVSDAENVPETVSTVENGRQTQTPLQRLPKDEKGTPIFEQAESPEHGWDALVEFRRGDTAKAQSIANAMLEEAKKAHEKTQKLKPKGKTVMEMSESQDQIEALQAQAATNYDYWQRVAAVEQNRQAAIRSQQEAEARRIAAERAEAEKAERAAQEEAARIEREALEGIPEWHMDTPENARARGSRRFSGQLFMRQEPVQGVSGKEVEVKFSQEDLPKGRVAVIEASQLQPSHIQGHRNPMFFIEEAQPKNRAEAVSTFAAKQIAEGIRPEEITGSTTAYTGAPTVNTRGEVIQGNNRSDALRYLWGNNLPQQQAAYKQYLLDNAEQLGIDPEAVNAMQQPVLVNMLDVDDAEAIRLGQMTAQDTESGGIERIKPKNVAQTLGDDMRKFANMLLRSGDEEASFGQLVDSNGAEVLRWMNQAGAITNTQYQSAFDSKGNLTAETKNDLQKVLYQAIFRGGSQQLEEMFDKLPAKAQRALLATAFRDMDSPFAGKMLPEIQASIAAYNLLMSDPTFREAKKMEDVLRAVEAFKATIALDDRFEQYMPADNFSNFALHLAAMYKASDMSQSTITSYFNQMYDLAQGKVVATLFEEADTTQYPLAEVIKKVLNIDYKPAKNGNNYVANGGADVALRNQVGQGGELRGSEPPASGEQTPAGTEPSDRGAGVADDSSTTGGRGDVQPTDEGKNNLQPAEVEKLDYQLSDEVDENGRQFVLNSKGSIEFGRIDASTGLTEAPILLSEGVITNPKTKDGYGLIHIEARHGKQIRDNGYASVLEFIESVAANWSIIREGKDRNGNQTYRLIAQDTHSNTLMVELSGDGTYWNINTAGIFKNSCGKNNREIYNRHTTVNQSTETDEASQGAEQRGTTEPSSMNAPKSDGKDNSLSQDKQISEGESSSELAEGEREQTIQATIETASAEVNPNPTEAQKEAGNYKKGHVTIGEFDITIENPAGSVRKGVDANGNTWETTMVNAYGYIKGTESADGDPLDVFLHTDMDAWDGRKVFVVDQTKEDGSFDEHKVMLGFNDKDEAMSAYLANYDAAWTEKHPGLRITEVNVDEFNKWIQSSKRKIEPFANYWRRKMIRYVLFEKTAEERRKDAQMGLEKLIQEKYEAFKAKYAYDDNEFTRILATSQTARDAVAECRKRADDCRRKAHDWANRQYKKNKNTISVQGEDGEYDNISITNINERRRQRAIYAYNKQAEEYDSWGDLIAKESDLKADVPKTTEESPQTAEKLAKHPGEDGIQYAIKDGTKEVTDRQRVLGKAVAGLLTDAGIEVVTDKEAMQSEYEKSLPIAVVRQYSKELSPRDVGLDPASYAAKLANISDNLAKIAEQREDNTDSRGIITDLANAIGAKGGASKYVDIRIDDDHSVSVRISNHNADASNYASRGRYDGSISIVFKSRKSGNRFHPDERVELTEYVYAHEDISKDGRIAAGVARSLAEMLKTGEYRDLTGKAMVNRSPSLLQAMTAWHGSPHEFNAFDHSKMGSGEGAQAHGWGTYVALNPNVSRGYAERLRKWDSEKEDAVLEELEACEDMLAMCQSMEGTWRDLKNDSDFSFSDMQYWVLDDFRPSHHSNGRDSNRLKLSECKNITQVRTLAKATRARVKELENVDFRQKANLYEIEIPEDNGENYLLEDKPLSNSQKEKIQNALKKLGVNLDDFAQRGFTLDDNFGALYRGLLNYGLRGTKAAKTNAQEATSKFLSKLGFVGIKYNGASDGLCAVIFKENDAKIVSHTQFLRTSRGEVYGFVKDGKVYLDEELMNPETPLHEYTHLWDMMVQREKPELWARGKELMKESPLWDEVKNDPAYSDIREDENAIASEVHSRLTGRRGAEMLDEMIADAGKDGAIAEAEAVSLVAKLRKWLRDMFSELKKTLGKWSKRELKNLTEDDFVNLTLRDLAEGMNPNHGDKELVTLHNISESKLRKALKAGGLANPSMAIVKAGRNSHDGYGAITLVARGDMADKRAGRNAGTWAGDAWTPTYPPIEREQSPVDKAEVIASITTTVPTEMRELVVRGWESHLSGGNENSLAYWFLSERGDAPEISRRKRRFDKKQAKMVLGLVGERPLTSLDEPEAARLREMYIREVMNGDEAEYTEFMKLSAQSARDRLGKPSGLMRMKAETQLDMIERLGLLPSIDRWVSDIRSDERLGERIDEYATSSEANRVIGEKGLTGEFEQWIENLDKQYGVKERLFAGYTPSGTRRYVANTVENASRLMKQQGRNGSTGMSTGFSTFVASILEPMKSHKAIREQSDRLRDSHGDTEAFDKKWSEVYYDLAIKCQPDAERIPDDYGFYRLNEAATKKNPADYLKSEYGIELSTEDVNKLSEMVNAIKKERPVKYFETKFERPVALEEFAAAVVPENIDRKLESALESAGLTIEKYSPEKEGDRQRAVAVASNQDGIRFHMELSKTTENSSDLTNVSKDKVSAGERLLAIRKLIPIKVDSNSLSKDELQEVYRNLPSVEKDGREIEFYHSAFKKIYKEGGLFGQIVPVLDEVLDQSVLAYSEEDNLGGKARRDGTVHREHKNISSFDNYIGKVRVGDTEYYVRTTVQIEKGMSGTHSFFVSNVDVYENPAESRTIPITSRGTTDLNRIADAKLQQFFEKASSELRLREAEEHQEQVQPTSPEVKRGHAVELSKKFGTPIRIVENAEELTHANTAMQARMRASKGFYDPHSGEVVVVLPNNTSVEDVAETVFHEVVAHRGLRELIGEENYDAFCDEVYTHLKDDLKEQIDQDATRRFLNDPSKGYEHARREAVDEMFGRLSEKGFEDFTKAEQGIWTKLRQKVLDAINKFLGSLKLPKWVKLGDNELRYMLWRSHERLRSTGMDYIDMARDVVKREHLKVGEYADMRRKNGRAKTPHQYVSNKGTDSFREGVVADRIETLFDEAVAGNLTGKPVEVGKLTAEGKVYLEELSGMTLKDEVSFVLNPSDLVHMYRDHFGDNEKDKGNNIPLTKQDIRAIADVVAHPARVIFGIEPDGLQRKLFYFLSPAQEGTYNLLEIYSDRKGNLTAKTFYKTKKAVSQRVLSLMKSEHLTSVTDGASLSTTKLPKFFEYPKSESTVRSEAGLNAITNPVANHDAKIENFEKPEVEPVKVVADRIETLFDEAVAGNLTGKPVEIGKLTAEGKAYLERLSGIKMKDVISFMVNPSDMVHIYRRHFGDNEKDERNIPLNKDDIRKMHEIICSPDRVVYGVEKNGQKREMFFFLKETDGGSHNLMEVYSDGKGNLTAKSFFKSKEGVSQRAMLLNESSTLTSVTDGATLLDGAKLPKFFEYPKSKSTVRSEVGLNPIYSSSNGDRNMTGNEARLNAITNPVTNHDAKLIEKIEIAKAGMHMVAENFRNTTDPRGFISALKSGLDMIMSDSSSGYKSFELFDGRILTIRVSNHNANAENARNPMVSIVIKRKHTPNSFISAEDKIVDEYVYFKEDIHKAPAGTLSSIAESISELLETGEYIDRTGLARENHSPQNREIHFRDGNDLVAKRPVLARAMYEQRVASSLYQVREAMQDSMAGLFELYRAIDKASGTKRYIEEVEDFQNAYLEENRLTSMNKAEQDAYERLVTKPMLDEVVKLAPDEKTYGELLNYMMAKHGLERNLFMRKRAKNDGIDSDKADATDFAGLTGLFMTDKVVDAESQANQLVNDYEAAHDTAPLWDSVNAATKATLSKLKEGGLISKTSHDKIADMYENYIPLRGWSETTADEVYGYVTRQDANLRGSVLKTANGRTSIADDPIATIAMMGQQAIAQANRNKMKQAFLSYVLKHPSDLVSVNQLWLRKNDVADEWEPVFASNINEGDDPATVEQKISDFENTMTRLAAAEPDKYKNGRQARGIPYKIGKGNLGEHTVLVKRGDYTYVLTINGNPRAAQALNGLTNPDVGTGVGAALFGLGEKFNHIISPLYTTRNPDFMARNFLRDAFYGNTMTWIKESPKYAGRLNVNFIKVNPFRMAKLINGYYANKLDMSNPLERQFHEFIMNGGETGYTNQADIEKQKKQVKKMLKRLRHKFSFGRFMDCFAAKWDVLNSAVENSMRFATYLTSRQEGRTILRSIYDAKEISVNFNKKGAGAKFMGAAGQTAIGNTAAVVSGIGRSLYVFWNAAVQASFGNFFKNAKRHPYKMTIGAMFPMFLLGALQAIIGAYDDEDESTTDQNRYFDKPDYERRSNILLRVGKLHLRYPLPQECRPAFSLGEMFATLCLGKDEMTAGEIALEIASLMSEFTPIQANRAGIDHALMPSYLKPFYEASINESWVGTPIYKENDFNKDMPGWTKAYDSTNPYLVTLSEKLNAWSGGDGYTKGAVDINPAKVDYVLRSLLGGYYKTADHAMKLHETARGEREFAWRDVPFMSAVVSQGDERTANRNMTNAFFNYMDEYKALKRRIKGYEKESEAGVFEYAEKLAEISRTPEFHRYWIIDGYNRELEAINKELKQASTEEEVDALTKERNALRKLIVGKLKGKLPLEPNDTAGIAAEQEYYRTNAQQ